jgi:uncharacterized protein (DUF1499 family)
MMKITLIVITILIFVAIAAFFVLGLISQSGNASGLIKNKLSKCSDKPNCVCSEFVVDTSHYLDPIAITATSVEEVSSRLKAIVSEMGGRIQTENGHYLAATFSSSVFGFVDDLELRIDTNQNMIHLRSASRVGYSDRGINLKRLQQLKQLYQSKTE